ncbi:hypothetical protein EJB05_52458, partial [Eragrostis curvula]
MASSQRKRMKPTSPDSTAGVFAGNWAALPGDILLIIFRKLGQREIMLGPELVCTAWRRVALELEPDMYRHIGWRTIDELLQRHIGAAAEMALGRVALARAAGQCESFKGRLSYQDLPYLVESAPSLKTLDIEEFGDYQQGTEQLIMTLQKLPMVENLEIYFTYEINRDVKMLRSVCQACPNLKKLVLMYAGSSDLECNEDDFDKEPIDGEIPMMHELHTLELYECDLTGYGLNMILDRCPLLESLHITGYFDKRYIDKELRVKCGGVKKLTLPTRLKPSDRCYYDYVRYYDSED